MRIVDSHPILKPLGRLIVVLVSLGAFSGCNPVSAVREAFVFPPSAEVVDVTVTGQSDEAVQLALLLEMRNPNDIDLPLRRSRASVSLGGLPTVSVNDRPPVTIPAKGENRFTLVTAIPTPAGFAVQGQSARVSGRLTFEPPGEIRGVLTETGVPLPTVGFSETLTLSTLDPVQGAETPSSTE